MQNIPTTSYIIITLALVYSFAMPTWGEVKNLMNERSDYKKAVLAIDDIKQKRTELLNKYNNVSEMDRKNIETMLPSSYDFVKLVSQIDSVASRYGISIANINGNIIPNTETDTTDASQIINKFNPESAVISFSFITNYSNFRNFLNELELSMRILDIKSLNVSILESGSYQFDLEFKTYWLSS